MRYQRRKAGGRSICAIAILLALGGAAASAAEMSFPFDQVLLLDAPPMRPAKRVPSLVVSQNGTGTIELWCRSVPARINLDERTILIEPEPLPEYAPVLQSQGQCTPERMNADVEMLAAFSEVSAWIRDRNYVTLAGGRRPLRLIPATN